MQSQTSEAIEEYVKQHNIPELFERMMQELVIHQPKKDPLQFLIDTLKRPSESFIKIAVIGRPFSGKKTLCDHLAKELGIVHLNYERDLLFSSEVKELISKGEVCNT